MRKADHSTPHGETPYSPTSLLRALTADPYGVDTLREHEHPAAEAAPPDVGATRAITLLLALLLGFVVAVSVLDLRQGAAAEDSPRALLEQEVLDTRGHLEAAGEEVEVGHDDGRRGSREPAADRDGQGAGAQATGGADDGDRAGRG